MSLISIARGLWNSIGSETQKNANTAPRINAAAQASLDAINELNSLINTKTTTRIYNTFGDLNLFLSDGTNSASIKNGDLFVFRDATTDYKWINGSLEPIVGQKTDLSNYPTNDDIESVLDNYYKSELITTTEGELDKLKVPGSYDVTLDEPHSIIGVLKFNLSVDLTGQTPIQKATYTNSEDYSIHKFERGSTLVQAGSQGLMIVWFDWGEPGGSNTSGNGITSIERTSGNGLAGSTDIYTITYSDTTTSTYTVVNGSNGNDGHTPQFGVDYHNGVDGATPVIGNGGYWFIDGVSTGVKAQGINGDPGTSPTIGGNGNWFIGSTDTGVKAQGLPGTPAPIKFAVFKSGGNGAYFPMNYPADTVVRTITAVRLASTCASFSFTVDGVLYSYVATDNALAITIPNGQEVVINTIECTNGNETTNALIIF